MSMSVSNVKQQQIQSLLDQFSAEGIRASGTIDSEKKTLTIQLANQAGETRSLTLGLPDLENPKGSAKLDEAAAKLEAMAADLKASDGAVANVSTGTLFDVYALIATLQKVAQKQRKVASEVRQNEHKSVQASLQMSADDIRKTSAITAGFGLGMAICSAATSAISVGAAIGTGVNTVKANNAAGLSDARASLNTARTDLSEAKGTTVQPSLSNENASEISKQLKNNPELSAKFDSVKTVGDTKSTIDGKIESAQKAVTASDQVVANKTGNYETAANQHAAEPDNANTQKVYENASGELKAAQQERAMNERQVSALKEQRADDIMAVKKGLDDKIKNMQPGEARDKLVTARNNFVGANRENIVEGLKIKVDNCRNDYAAACKLSMENGNAQWANGFKTVGDVCNQLGKAVESFQGVEKSKSESEQQAKLKEDEVRVEQDRAQLDSAKELYDESRQMLQMILDMRKAIEQMDAQLAQTIMRA